MNKRGFGQLNSFLIMLLKKPDILPLKSILILCYTLAGIISIGCDWFYSTLYLHFLD